MTDLIKACGLWTRVSSTTGKKYLTGRLGGLRVLVFENARRGEEGEPDFHLHLGEAAPYKPPALPRQQPVAALVEGVAEARAECER